MANAKIDVLGVNELGLVAGLYSQVFHPARDEAFFKRRFLGRYNNLIMVASVDGQPAGFALGFELKPTVFFGWLYGVLSVYRRAGIASQLIEAMHSWSKEHGYESMRHECQNRHKAMIHMAHSVAWAAATTRRAPCRRPTGRSRPASAGRSGGGSRWRTCCRGRRDGFPRPRVRRRPRRTARRRRGAGVPRRAGRDRRRESWVRIGPRRVLSRG